MSIKQADFDRPPCRRYRFVFLDGCRTSLGNLLGSFGIYNQEWSNPATENQVAYYGALQTTTYGTGQTPGAFLAYKTDTITLIFSDVNNHHRVNGFYLHSYDALCDWHATLSSSWRYVTPLWQALQGADLMFNSPPANMPRIEPSATVQTAPGVWETFNPRNHLLVYGSALLTNP